MRKLARRGKRDFTAEAAEGEEDAEEDREEIQHKEGRRGGADREFNTSSEKFIHTNYKSRITNHGRAKRDSTQRHGGTKGRGKGK